LVRTLAARFRFSITVSIPTQSAALLSRRHAVVGCLLSFSSKISQWRKDSTERFWHLAAWYSVQDSGCQDGKKRQDAGTRPVQVSILAAGYGSDVNTFCSSADQHQQAKLTQLALQQRILHHLTGKRCLETDPGNRHTQCVTRPNAKGWRPASTGVAWSVTILKTLGNHNPTSS
jgi:hypothetical protein